MNPGIDTTHHVALYRNHSIVYEDGSPALVPAGESVGTIPGPYLEFAKEHFPHDPMGAAEQRWKASQEWRSNHNVWNILPRPPVRLRDMERVQPMYFHGVSKDGHLVMYEPMRDADYDAMFQNGLTVEHHMARIVYLYEFARHELCRGRGRYYDNDNDNPETTFTNPSSATTVPTKPFSFIYVKDLLDVDVGKYLGGPAFQFRMKCFDLMRAHYPGGLAHAFCLNLPRWLAVPARPFLKAILWGLQTPELLFQTNNSGSHRNNLRERMLQVIDEDQLPVEYGGTSPYQLGEHPLQKRYLAFTEHYLQLQQQQQQRIQQQDLTETTVTSTLSKAMVASEKSSSCLSSSLHSVPSTLSSSSSIMIPQHGRVQGTVPTVPTTKHIPKEEEDASPSPSPPVGTQMNPLSALVVTVWLGVWTFWSAILWATVQHLHRSTPETTTPFPPTTGLHVAGSSSDNIRPAGVGPIVPPPPEEPKMEPPESKRRRMKRRLSAWWSGRWLSKTRKNPRVNKNTPQRVSRKIIQRARSDRSDDTAVST